MPGSGPSRNRSFSNGCSRSAEDDCVGRVLAS
jgi:hypothetical protein